MCQIEDSKESATLPQTIVITTKRDCSDILQMFVREGHMLKNSMCSEICGTIIKTVTKVCSRNLIFLSHTLSEVLTLLHVAFIVNCGNQLISYHFLF